ncbi:MAG: HAMP domain-containing histidine kinase, partial [Anaerolineae bacterium]|nr:HAMP domain-containing histidine kinase [Anaerolineae bacterium]
CEIIKQAVAAAQNELKIHNHTLEVDCPPDLPVIRGNPIKLERAIYNLIQNAIKYTPSPGEIKVRAYIKPYGPRSTIAVEVRDNGIGIPLDQQERLFQRGFRAHQPGTEHIQGTGVGLSTVKTTVEEHSGNIYFDSTPDEGSMFGFWIPLRDDRPSS